VALNQYLENFHCQLLTCLFCRYNLR